MAMTTGNMDAMAKGFGPVDPGGGQKGGDGSTWLVPGLILVGGMMLVAFGAVGLVVYLRRTTFTKKRDEEELVGGGTNTSTFEEDPTIESNTEEEQGSSRSQPEVPEEDETHTDVTILNTEETQANTRATDVQKKKTKAENTKSRKEKSVNVQLFWQKLEEYWANRRRKEDSGKADGFITAPETIPYKKAAVQRKSLTATRSQTTDESGTEDSIQPEPSFPHPAHGSSTLTHSSSLASHEYPTHQQK